VKKSIGLLLAIPLLAALPSASAQQSSKPVNTCSMTLSAAPELWGFKLGMPMEQVRERYPSLRLETSSSFGVTGGHVMASEDSATQRNYKWQLSGLFEVNLQFSDAKLSFIGPVYDPRSFRYPSLDAYIAMLSKAYGLPNEWVIDKNVTFPYKTMKCGEVFFGAMAGTSVGFLMFDAKAREAFDERVNKYQKSQYPTLPAVH